MFFRVTLYTFALIGAATLSTMDLSELDPIRYCYTSEDHGWDCYLAADRPIVRSGLTFVGPESAIMQEMDR
jgi:hypothetical protein